jgi:TRAP-type C4-dicarboxylate transport system substrate-binding protein
MTQYRMMAILRLLAAVMICQAAVARAEPVQLRMATIAPDGTKWIRELKAFGRDIETKTQGRVTMKWYFGAIAGDELQVVDRIRRGQLDGEAGAQVCDRLAPSLRIMRVLGLFQTYDEASYVIGRLRVAVDGQFRQSGFFGAATEMGNDILFSRTPIGTLSALRASHLWMWNLDDVLGAQLETMGIHPVRLPVDQAGAAYDDGRISGFVAIPTAALAYQWSSRSRYFTNLRLAFLPACMIISNQTFDALSLVDQQAVREATAKLESRFADLGRTQDAQLIDGLFAKQGVKPVAVSDTFRAEFFESAAAAREKIPEKLVPRGLLLQVEGWLADYRVEHRR